MRIRIDVPTELAARADIAPILRESKTYFEGLGHHPSLGEETKPSAEIRAVTNERGTPILVFELHEYGDSAVRAFYPDQMPTPSVIRLRLGEMRGELLRRQSHASLSRVREAVSQMAEEN